MHTEANMEATGQHSLGGRMIERWSWEEMPDIRAGHDKFLAVGSVAFRVWNVSRPVGGTARPTKLIDAGMCQVLLGARTPTVAGAVLATRGGTRCPRPTHALQRGEHALLHFPAQDGGPRGDNYFPCMIRDFQLKHPLTDSKIRIWVLPVEGYEGQTGKTMRYSPPRK